MRNILYSAALTAALVLCAATASAQVNFGTSPNPVGSGARAMGMGGAFIAVADDATAASWNPAGLVQLEKPEVSAVGSFSYRREDVRSASFRELDAVNSTSAWDLNYLSAAYPFTLFNRNMVVSVNYQKLYDMNLDYKGGLAFSVPGLDLKEDINFMQRGGMSTVSPAFAAQITPTLSVGFTFNFWANPFGDNGWESVTRQRTQTTFPFTPPIKNVYFQQDKNNFYGTNYNVGVMYSPTASLTVAAVYKSKFISNVKRERVLYNDQLVKPLNTSKDYLHLTMPESYGMGASYRFTDAFTLALDAYRTEWGEFILNTNGRMTRPHITKREQKSKTNATTQVRMGGEYLFIKSNYTVPVRAGVFYDPEPSENDPNTFYGVSIGSGVSYGPLAFDAAYTFRRGKTGEALGAGLADSYIIQHSALFSVIYHF